MAPGVFVLVVDNAVVESAHGRFNKVDVVHVLAPVQDTGEPRLRPDNA